MEEIKLIKKYQRLARTASFNNSFLENIRNADMTKSLYENHITSGTSIDGKCIRLKTLEKWFGEDVVNNFRNAVKNHFDFSAGRFNLYGYEATLWVKPFDNGMVVAGLNKEFRGCVNGYYYLLINDETFIGYEID